MNRGIRNGAALPAAGIVLMIGAALAGCSGRRGSGARADGPPPISARESVSATSGTEAILRGAKREEESRLSSRSSTGPEEMRSAAGPAPSSSSSLEVLGKVVLGNSGTPAEGALVWLASPEGEAPLLARTTAGADGTFRLRHSGASTSAVLYASLPGYAVDGTVLPETDNPEDGTAVLRLFRNLELAPASFLRGQVTDDSGSPLAGVLVRASRLGFSRSMNHYAPPPDVSLQTWEALTDPQGRFALEELPAGGLVLEISREGYVSLTKPAEAPADGVRLTLTTRGAAVEGHVFHHETGAGVPGVTLQLEAGFSLPGPGTPGGRFRTVVTDALGAFSFSGLPEGTYRISGSRDGLLVRSRDPEAGNLVTLSAAETTAELDLLLHPGHTATGQVTDEATGEPLEEVEVRATEVPGVSARTDAQGRYRLPGLVATGGSGWTILHFSRPGYLLAENHSGMELLRLDAGRDEVTKNVRMRPVVRISGRVVDGEGRPVSGARVGTQHAPAVREGETGADGKFDVEVFPERKLTLKARAEACGTGYASVTLEKPGDVSGVEIVISPTASVGGIVVDEEGKPADQFQVLVSFAPGTEGAPAGGLGEARRFAQTGGRFHFPELPGRSLLFVAEPQPAPLEWLHSAPLQVDLAPGEKRDDLRLVLRRSRTLEGVVVNGRGEPVVNAAVTARAAERMDSVGGFTTTDGRGRFQILNLATGEVNVSVEAGDPYEPLHLKKVKTGQEELRLTLHERRPMLLIGTVIDARTSEPVSRFDVYFNDLTTPVQPGMVAERFLYQQAEPGMFTLSDYPSGSPFRILVRAPGYEPFDTGFRRMPLADEAADGGPVFEVSFPLRPAGSP